MISQLQYEFRQAMKERDFEKAYMYAGYLDYYQRTNINTLEVMKLKQETPKQMVLRKDK